MFRLVFRGSVKGISQVFWGCFKCILRVFPEGFKYIPVVLRGCSKMFLSQKGLLLCTVVIAATHANSIKQKQPKNTHGRSVVHSRSALFSCHCSYPNKRRACFSLFLGIYFFVNIIWGDLLLMYRIWEGGEEEYSNTPNFLEGEIGFSGSFFLRRSAFYAPPLPLGLFDTFPWFWNLTLKIRVYVRNGNSSNPVRQMIKFAKIWI